MLESECVGMTSELDWMRKAMHDLSQPLTALECGLFVGTISVDGVKAPTAEELMATILAALEQCDKATKQVRAIQERMQNELEREGMGPV